MSPEAMALGAAIRAVREAKGLTQIEASARGGFTQSEWSRAERGVLDIHVVTLIRMARALRVKPGAILNRATSPPSPPQ